MKNEYVKVNKKLKAAIYNNPGGTGTKLEPDEKGSQIFVIQDAGDGDESMAVKPWRGACKEPAEHPPIKIDLPDQRYEIDFVYGYRCEDARQNVLYNSKKKVVYMTAALGIVFDAGTKK